MALHCDSSRSCYTRVDSCSMLNQNKYAPNSLVDFCKSSKELKYCHKGIMQVCFMTAGNILMRALASFITGY
jgi:hypothetical protein